jgi:hypothetical protein
LSALNQELWVVIGYGGYMGWLVTTGSCHHVSLLLLPKGQP